MSIWIDWISWYEVESDEAASEFGSSSQNFRRRQYTLRQTLVSVRPLLTAMYDCHRVGSDRKGQLTYKARPLSSFASPHRPRTARFWLFPFSSPHALSLDLLAAEQRSHVAFGLSC